MASESDSDVVRSEAFTQSNWVNVLSAMDATYAELLDHQTKLEEQNAELHEVRRLLGSILGSISDVMVVLDREGGIEDASDSFRQTIGGDVDGKIFADHLRQGDRHAFAEAWGQLRFLKTPPSFEIEINGAEGAAPFELTLSPRQNDRGRFVGAVILGRPLGELRRAYLELAESHDELKQTQAHLVRNEKLASLGRLLAGVAHELNNPISFVYANAHALERYVQRFESYFARVTAGASRAELIALRDELKLERALANLRSAIDGARDGAERVRDIVADLRRLSSDGGGEMEAFDLVSVSEVAARWVERGSKSGITPKITGEAGLTVMGNPGHIQQIVMNLVQNAMDAMKDVEEPRLTLTVKREADLAVLTVADNGPGVPERLAASIFDPFFTTKAVGSGTGLGLAISHKIAEEHGGRLNVVPGGDGATFRLELPMGDAK